MSKRSRLTKADIIFDVINYLLLSVALIVVLFPLIFILSASISDPTAVASGKVFLLPKNITFEGYQRIFANSNIWLGYKNTIAYTIIGTIVNVVLTIMAAYPLSRKDFYGRKLFLLMLTVTMFFQGGLIPTYLLIKELNMINTIWVMIIPNAITVWNVIITKTYFESSIPQELNDAGQIDGCTNRKFLVSIVLPLSKPIIAVITLYYAVSHWNSFFDALIYINDNKLYPLQLVLRNILVMSEMSTNMITDVDSMLEQQRIADLIRYGVIIVASVPVLCMYPFMQKYFVKGVMVGSLKG